MIRTRCFIAVWVSGALLWSIATAEGPLQRTTAIAITASNTSTNAATKSAGFSVTSNALALVRDEQIRDWEVKGWEPYLRLWAELAETPRDVSLRKYLGLPIGSSAGKSVAIKTSRGRSAPRWMNWSGGTYQQIETPHLRIYSRADLEEGLQVAEDLERLYWIWTQVFFPLWEGRGQVALHLDGIDQGQSVSSQLSASNARVNSRKKLRIVLFRDATEYRNTLGQSTPGIEQSTGFYSDERETSFFYPDDSSDAVATRRHELVHQLFREATRSGLGSKTPGMEREFWLIEGMAGYFESLKVRGSEASLGGWQSPRLQFARYRVLGGREEIPLAELRAGGQKQVQQSADLAKWYAHAIAQTHHLFDGGSAAERRWIYQTLADLYRISIKIPDAELSQPTSQSLAQFLTLNQDSFGDGRIDPGLEELCLAGCEIDDQTLGKLGAMTELRWLDLSRCAVGPNAIARLCADPSKLDQLSLEATRADDSLTDWLSRAASLSELDLSWTRCGDDTVKALSRCKHLHTVWLTGSQVSDASIDAILKWPSIESIDVQRTSVTPAGLARLKAAKPAWKINPLRLIEQ